jgi:hypothetical protein
VNPDLPDEVLDFAAAAEQAVVAAGGVELARRAFDDPKVRGDEVPALLSGLGIDDVDPRDGEVGLLAAAELVRITGAYALPYPVSARLAAPHDGDAAADFVAVVDGTPAVEHVEVGGRWLVVETDGTAWEPVPVLDSRRYTSARHVRPVTRGTSRGSVGLPDVALPLVLDGWRMLGAAEQAHAYATAHVGVRQQFGRALADFQAVQFRVADSEVAVRGLGLLARFTAWRWLVAPDEALVDAWALRVQAIETLKLVLANSHLLHGAVGFCDEHDLSVIDMGVQPAVRLPADLERSTELLGQAVRQHGFASPFSDPARATVEARRAAREVDA